MTISISSAPFATASLVSKFRRRCVVSVWKSYYRTDRQFPIDITLPPVSHNKPGYRQKRIHILFHRLKSAGFPPILQSVKAVCDLLCLKYLFIHVFPFSCRLPRHRIAYSSCKDVFLDFLLYFAFPICQHISIFHSSVTSVFHVLMSLQLCKQ